MNKSSKAWTCGLLIVVLFLGWFLTRHLTSQWTEVVDFNGAVWSQAAHNLLLSGLKTTSGVPAVFYFGPMPIPADGYYGHHPALLHLEIAGLFYCFGEHEWVARSLPIFCSLLSALLIWLLVNQCAGARTATLSTALFAVLPMELHYGAMVNFEPCTLMWMLLGMLGLRYWELTGKKGWWAVMIAGFSLAMFTAWLGYFLVLILCIDFVVRKKHRGLALLLFGIALGSGALFLLQIRQSSPEAWQDLANAFRLRFSHNLSKGVPFTFAEWCDRVGYSLLHHIQPLSWLLAAGGVVAAWRSRRASTGLHWLNWASLCFFALSAFYVVVFRNASFIHDYASFYFIAPVAIMGGVGLNALAELIDQRVNARFRFSGAAMAVCIVLLAGWSGFQGAQRLEGQAFLLETDDAEPPDLVPALGSLIQAQFAPDAEVLCNFATDYTPQFNFYSQRFLINGLITGEDWKDSIENQAPVTGGVIWMGAPEAKDILSILPKGPRREVKIGGIPFCVWNGRL